MILMEYPLQHEEAQGQWLSPLHAGINIYKIFLQACRSVPKLGGSGGMLPQENFEIYNLWDCFWWLLRSHAQMKITLYDKY